MLSKLAFATIAAIAFTVPIIGYTIEESGQQLGTHHKHGANQDGDRLMQESDGYGLGDLGDPGMNEGGSDAGQEGYGNDP